MNERAGGLIDLQRRFRELGRLRMGRLVTGGKGRPRPEKLEHWRLTSHSRTLLDHAARVWGGSVQVWENAPVDGDNFELITETKSLPIIVPPGHVLSQHYELWSGGGCQRRCFGPNEEGTSRRADRDVACSCPLDIGERMEQAQKGQACKPTTRLSVILPDIPDIGVWRLESHGYNAATELAGTYDICRMATEKGQPIAALLTIQPREVKREGQTKKFMVPIIEIEARVGEVIDSIAQAQLPPAERRELPGARPALPTDAGVRPEDEGGVAPQSWPEPEPIPEPEEPDDLPAWILQLPGSDPEICDAAMAAAAEAGKPQEIASLRQLAELNISVPGQKAIRKKLESLENPEQGQLG